MEYVLDLGGQERLKAYFDEIGEVLRNKRRRESFAVYALGLLGDGERKSMEPMAARACPDPELVDAAHQRLTYFTRRSPWSDRDVRQVAVRYALAVMRQAGEPVVSWIVDDTGLIKQGTHSVGVQRQYTGSAGKVTNCQIAVSLSVATARDHLLADMALYVPQSWIDDRERRAEVKIPEELTFKTKPELALEMIERALEDGVPPGLLLADSAYGDNAEFRRRVRCAGLDYAVGLHRTSTVWRLDRLGRRVGAPVAVGDLAIAIGRRRFRRTTWRDATKGKLASKFAAQRVVLGQDDGVDPSQREAVWLLMEWPDAEEEPANFTVATLPARLSRRQLVRRIKERWRTERVYEDAKGELGLDHFEGRTFPGWNHHVSILLCCFAFIVAERIRAFPPSAAKTTGQRETGADGTLQGTPRAALRRVVHHDSAGGRSRRGNLVATLPALPQAAS